MKKMCILVILDGWGVGKRDESNPIYMAKIPVIRSIEENFPAGALQASGISVGLPWDSASSSEIGHAVIGTGKVMYQDYPRISLAVRDGSFFENEKLKACFAHAKKNSGTVHCVGTISLENSEGSLEHVEALLKMAKQEECAPVSLHLILNSKIGNFEIAKKLIEKIAKRAIEEKTGIISSITGSYFAKAGAEKSKLFLSAIFGQEKLFETYENALRQAEGKNARPDLLEPSSLADGVFIKNGDGIVFFDFNGNGIENAVQSIEQNDIPSVHVDNIFVTTLSSYEGVRALPAFPKDRYGTTLSEAIANAGKTQMKITEELKNKSISYYFNGLREEPCAGEYRAIVPSLKNLSPAEHPELMAKTITERAIIALTEQAFDFVVVNYANPDIIATTGNYEATKRAIEIVDAEVGKIVNAALRGDHTVIITGSHGNAEMLLNLETGEADTKNNPNPVPLYLVKNSLRKRAPEKIEKLPQAGILADVAPTILDLMNIPIPKEMTGESLSRELS